MDGAVTITLVRAHAYMGGARTFHIAVGGVDTAGVRNGETIRFLVPPGLHVFQIEPLLGYARSNTVQVDCRPGGFYELHLKLTMTASVLRLDSSSVSAPLPAHVPAPQAARPAPASRPSRHVFLSYARVDQAYVIDLARHLGQAGLPVWYDTEIEPGHSFSLDIERAISECFAFVIVLTPASAGSEWVRLELSRARRLRKEIWPLVLADCDLPLEVEGLQSEDVTGGRMPTAGYVGRLVTLHRS